MAVEDVVREFLRRMPLAENPVTERSQGFNEGALWMRKQILHLFDRHGSMLRHPSCSAAEVERSIHVPEWVNGR